MEDPSKATSCKHERSSPKSPNDPPSKRRKSSMLDTTSYPTTFPQNKGVLEAMHKLTNLVERHPQFHSKLERMLEEAFNVLEPEVSAVVRKEKNEDSCPIYKVSNDSIKHIFGYVGEMQYGFVACISDRFRRAYLETFKNQTWTSIENAVVSVSCAKLCLEAERPPDCTALVKTLFIIAASAGKLEVLEWGKKLGYKLDTVLDKHTIADAALYGHLKVVKYLRKLGIPWDKWTCTYAALNGHLELLKWCRVNQCPWDEETCAMAAKNGHLELLKWARENGCPWDENTYLEEGA